MISQIVNLASSASSSSAISSGSIEVIHLSSTSSLLGSLVDDVPTRSELEKHL